ncbi:prepilin-type N-terminal cleavage/methylation domain-containing protein (plasmid) [Deinococcus wulumuqiensis]|uniref:Prepilin-type N-terminal cleavage/methylation domain-containing protein n=1 Tax=Deinococcus wulumuqiensis TaxID=980427 RepID=A0A345ILW5_9DEIO|nr:prepilin-type N-terminal cleavage/methylation domain-containing protein [Deinococcus wulumuqiensis]AXH00688.1 prepilin-type N-terminal cleavage/methylation domain-containing protein [Deinococcus wulumuqiensis]
MRQDGFTLIELLIAVAIIAALAVILLPSYNGALKDSDQRRAQMHAQSVRLALNTALANNPQSNAASWGDIDCTQAKDVGSSGVTAATGGNGWEAAPTGYGCNASPLTSLTYKVTVTLPDGSKAEAP